MARLKDLKRPGYVPLKPEEWQRALATLLQVVAGNMPGPPPHAQLVGPRGDVFMAPDTPFNKGVIAACIPLMDEPAKPMSFLARFKQPWKVAREDPQYEKFRDNANSTMHAALIAAIAQVPFNDRTTPKVLKAAFAKEFDKQSTKFGDAVVRISDPLGWPTQSGEQNGETPGATHAIAPLPGVVAGSYVPLTLAEFRKAYTRMLRVAGGLEEAPPVKGDEVASVDTGEPVTLEDTPFNRGWIAGARSLGDNGSPKPTSFVARVIRVLPIVQGPEYADHRTDEVTFHVALIAAMAAVQFNGKTSEQDLRRAFAAEASRQFDRIDELMAEAMAEPDFQHQAIGSTRH